MMDVGMRNYHDGAYWDDLWNEVEIIHSSNDQSTLGQFFIETIKRYDLAVFREEKRKYVNNIMMHAFIPENEGYRDAFFNFVLRFYRIVLNSSVSEDLDEKLQTMADVFRENSLSDFPEMSSIPLIASTKYALSDVSYFGGTVRKIIRRFAQDYDTVEEVNLGRYEESYRAWINSHSNGRVKRRSIGEKPYVHFNIDRNQLMLVIPAREVSRAGNIPIEVEISGEKRTDSVVATIQFGKAITEEKVLIMNWNPLSPFVVRIDGNQIMNTVTGQKYDISGNAALEEGKEGSYALRFNGNESIDLGTEFQPVNEYTMMGWIKPDQGGKALDIGATVDVESEHP